MTLCCINKEKIENAVIRVSDEIDACRKTGKNWEKCSEEQLWYELVSCILGSRVRYETAKECTNHLKDEGLLTIPKLLTSSETVGVYLIEELNKPLYSPYRNGKGSRYPYPKSKSQYIIKTGLEIYKNGFTSVKHILKTSRDENMAREKLVKICTGIGPKQASLFLRNIGYSENLAILDTHVIHYMDLLGMRDRKTRINTMNEYSKHENILLFYADSLNKTLATMDIAIWVVMRVIQKGF